MDRFRGRLIVPILDATGQHVLGFGGRLLLPANSGDHHLNKAPRYINSPESAVFSKKHVLFGQNLLLASPPSSPRTDPLVLVEGYMDAVALWSVGYESVVATMGTAISQQQLRQAAAFPRIVLLLDNDEAGIAAVERLCRNGFLLELQQQPCVAVATLPSNCKDPADFCEERLAQGKDRAHVRQAFCEQVVATAVDWVDWFLRRLVNTYNATATEEERDSSFGSLFEQVANVLASLPERTERASNIAGTLARMLGNASDETALCLQLESDLLDLSSRIASAQRMDSPRSTVASLGRGTGVELEDSFKLARNATSAENLDGYWAPPDTLTSNSRRTTKRKLRPRGEYKPLTPHFAGFAFAHQSDADWLGISKQAVRWFCGILAINRRHLLTNSIYITNCSGSAKVTLLWAVRHQVPREGER